MISPAFVAALLAAIHAAVAQSNSTSYFTRCTTNFGYYRLPTGMAGVPTWITYVQPTQTVMSTNTIRDTITITPNATTGGGTITETSTETSTSTVTLAATTVRAEAGQFPLLILGPTAINPTPTPRVRRYEIGAGSALLEVKHLVNRQTKPGNTGGFMVNPDGTISELNRVFPHRVFCERRRSVIVTREVVESAAPTTTTLVQSTATAAMSTIMVTTTVMLIETAPTPKVWDACGGNNVVNSMTKIDGNRMNFDHIIFRPQEGFPITNELVVNTTGPVNCCGACQDIVRLPFKIIFQECDAETGKAQLNCAGSFFVPSHGECHLRLTAPAPSLPSNATLALPGSPSTFNNTLALPSGSGIAYPTGYPTAPGIFPPALGTGTAISSIVPPSSANSSSLVPAPLGTASPGTCAAGSLSLYLKTIWGRPASDFPQRVALWFSNGPCGRFTVSSVPVRVNEVA